MSNSGAALAAAGGLGSSAINCFSRFDSREEPAVRVGPRYAAAMYHEEVSHCKAGIGDSGKESGARLPGTLDSYAELLRKNP